MNGATALHLRKGSMHVQACLTTFPLSSYKRGSAPFVSHDVSVLNSARVEGYLTFHRAFHLGLPTMSTQDAQPTYVETLVIGAGPVSCGPALLPGTRPRLNPARRP